MNYAVDATLVAIVVAMTELVKVVFNLNRRFAPLVSLTFGLILALGAEGLTYQAAVKGIIYGLTASGLYSGGKAVVKG